MTRKKSRKHKKTGGIPSPGSNKSHKKITPLKNQEPKKTMADRTIDADILKPIQGQITDKFDVESFSNSLDTQFGFMNGINAVSLRASSKDKYYVEIAVPPENVESTQKALKSSQVPETNAKVVSCNRLSYFAPEAVHTKTIKSAGIENSGSCGAFVKHGGKISVLSAGHVFDRKDAQMAIALPLSQDAMMGKVTHHVNASTQGLSGLGLIDLGIAELKNTEPLSNIGVTLFPTKIGKPNLNDRVRIFGATSTMQIGTISSLNASPTINNVKFHGLIQLDILSQPGDSGAVVVNDHDQIIGLVIGGDTDPVNRRVYCSNLDKNKGLLPDGFKNKLHLHGTRSGPITRDLHGSVEVSRRREAELWIHRGTLTKVATPGNYGEIMVARAGSRSEEIQVLTHFDHSFEEKDGGKKFEGRKVYFFAIPLEYIMKADQMVGLSNQSPLVAVNVTRKKFQLASMGGFHKVTPCGGGSTTQSSPTGVLTLAVAPLMSHVVYPSAKRKRKKRIVRNPSQAFINYIINDYGQVILVKSIGRPIEPYEKIIGQGKPEHKNPPSGVPGIANERLYYREFIDDHSWQWE